jgi:arsenate reductase-like glutaredoxin family protein
LQAGVGFKERDFFKEPFTMGEIKELIAKSHAADMFNFKSPSFKKTGLDSSKLSDEELVNLMLNEPRLIKRPVVRIGKKVYFSANDRVLKEIIK